MNRYIGLLLLMAVSAPFCKKSDQFYDTLNNIPELDNSSLYAYRTDYAVGDTMMLHGRLNPDNGLVIHIGNADAPVISSLRDSFRVAGGRKTVMDQVKVLITDDMGAGSQRPVTITSGGYTVHGAPVEIRARYGSAFLRDSVKLDIYYNLLFRSVFFNHVNGKGTLYFYGNGSIQKMQKQAVVSSVLTAADLKDQYSSPFTIQTLLAGTVDAKESQLYFSAITTDTSLLNANNVIYRLCKLDLQSHQLTTINRTVIPKTMQQVWATHYQPFEGPVADVKLTGATGLYADNAGNVFMRINGNYAIARLRPDGKIKYVYKSLGNTGNPLTPKVWDPVTNKATPMALGQLPGLQTDELLATVRIDPNEKLLYTRLDEAVNVYDLDAGIPLYQLKRQLISDMDEAVVIGPFANLTSKKPTGGQPFFWGFMPINGVRLVQMNYRGYATSSWSVLDFQKGRADFYAPNTFSAGIYAPKPTDVLLNYDEEGHLYMTANDGAQIVKTVKK